MSQTIEFQCPFCQRTIRAPARNAGQAGPCPKCNQRIVVPGTPETSSVVKFGREERRHETTDPNPAITGLIGAAAAAALYLLVFFPLHDQYLGRLMIDRGPCQYLSTFVTCWGLATLALKFYAVKKQASYAELELDFIPYEVNMQITPRSAGAFIQHIERMPSKARNSILGRRVLGALEHLQARGQVPEVQSYLASANQVDSSFVESGYTLLKAFIWLVPILGFIGTVTGISDAVASLSSQFGTETPAPADPGAAGSPAGNTGGSGAAPGTEKPVDKEQDLANKLVKAMGGVTQGLATAFDTTFLGLVCAIVLLFPTETLRKAEYAMLDRIELFINRSLLRRMSDEDQKSALSPELARALEPAFQEHQRWLLKWQAQVGELGDAIGRRLEEHMAAIVRRLADFNAAQAGSIGNAAASVTQGTQALAAGFQQMKEVAERSAGANKTLLEATARLQELLRDNTQRLSDLVVECPGRWQALTASLDQLRAATAESCNRLSVVLSDGHAGRETPPARPKRGWFSLWS
jgi:biopolymer transport protein ExbB/TolQ